jgi:Family of unknown function (DUF6496)
MRSAGGAEPYGAACTKIVTKTITTRKVPAMAKYGAMAKEEVRKAVKKTEHGTQKSGKKGKAKSRKQAIAIGLSKARKKGAKVPAKKGSGKK